MDSSSVSVSSNAPNSSAANASYTDHGSKVLGIVALVSSCVSLGAVAMYVILASQLIDSKIQAGIAKSEQTSHAAETNARVALDKVQNIKVELAKRGITIKDD
jgi:hypothetical protein